MSRIDRILTLESTSQKVVDDALYEVQVVLDAREKTQGLSWTLRDPGSATPRWAKPVAVVAAIAIIAPVLLIVVGGLWWVALAILNALP